MINIKLFLILLFNLCFFSSICQASTTSAIPFQHPLYIGGMGGYGSTTWDGLVPSQGNQNSALSLSTPVKVKEGGGVWGLFFGYEFIPSFALEASYMRYRDATVNFDAMSLFSFNNENETSFVTHTEVVNIMGKIMLVIPRTNVRVYSSAGIANVHREDILKDDWLLSPTFGVGVNYHFAEHILGEIGANCTAGFGESNLNPTESYFPFLYSITLRLAYCF